MAIQVHNRVTLTLALLMTAALTTLPFLNWAPNRLVSGQPVALAQIADGVGWWLLLPAFLLMLLAFLPQRRAGLALTLACSETLFVAMVAAGGFAAASLAQQGHPLARTSYGGGFWLASALALLIATDAIGRATQNAMWRLLLNAQIWLPIVFLLLSGQLDALSLLKEYANRKEVFDEALSRHLLILGGTLLPALLIGVPLGWYCCRRPGIQSSVFTTLNIIQTVPSVALFGLLIAPLSGLAREFPALATLGISGIGMAPALIALVLYALLPLVRSVVAGLQNVPDAAIETAQGMGMSRGQIFRKVEVPLALPVLLAGLRVTAVQTIGMAVIAALIGAGGFGAVIFQGLLSSALDLVMLGVIPVIALAVGVDALFKLLLSLPGNKTSD
ncbi:ABC transporter permease [Kalamiella sp. sgz302252]|uniref:ABC transporter permease n=1 Tax=Pantoea sp. sgz302252 TaxID=3341827 RepID=UPI0036D2A90D